MNQNNEIPDLEDELFEHHRFVSPKGQSLLRVDKFLMQLIENATRNKIQKAAEDGNIWVNDIPVKSNYRVKPFDVVRVMLTHPPFENHIIPEDIPLDIVYEDDALLVINKPAGLVVHPGHGNYTGTLVNALAFHFDNLPMNSSERPGLVHRIDKDTSGLLVIAKSEAAMSHLAKQFFHHTIERTYYALVWGEPKEEKATIKEYLGRSPKDRRVVSVYNPDEAPFAKLGITHYEILQRLRYVSLLKCNLETGRTHQIRAHLKHVGHPLFNDEMYGGNAIVKGTVFTKYKAFVENCFKIMPRQALHAKSLGFIHPITGKQMYFEIDLPEDFKAVIEKWEHYLKYN
jgi:23S rRNA pseudouridine1911/1915/1917 synthase